MKRTTTQSARSGTYFSNALESLIRRLEDYVGQNLLPLSGFQVRPMQVVSIDVVSGYE